MYCIHCGKKIEDNENYCMHCGKYQNQPTQNIVSPNILDSLNNVDLTIDNNKLVQQYIGKYIVGMIIMVASIVLIYPLMMFVVFGSLISGLGAFTNNTTSNFPTILILIIGAIVLLVLFIIGCKKSLQAIIKENQLGTVGITASGYMLLFFYPMQILFKLVGAIAKIMTFSSFYLSSIILNIIGLIPIILGLIQIIRGLVISIKNKDNVKTILIINGIAVVIIILLILWPLLYGN